MKTLFIIIFKFVMNIIYSIFKLFPTQNKIIFCSRQSNELSLDSKMLIDEIKKRNSEIKVVIFVKRFDNMKKHFIKYGWFTIRQMYHLATSKVCVTDSYCIPISILKHKKSLRVIQIWHSLGAIKQFGYQTIGKEEGRDAKVAKLMRMHEQYDAIISGSEESTKFFMKAFNYPKESFYNYGLPRIDYLLNERNNLKKEIYKKYPVFRTKKVIMYCPTFRNNHDDQFDSLIKHFNFERYILILKSHPNQEIHTSLDDVYLCPEFSSLDLLSVCNYIITDYSAIAIEAAVLNVKTLYYVYDYEEYSKENGLNIDLFEEMPNCVYRDPYDLLLAIDKDNYPMDCLIKYKKKYLPDKIGHSTERIVDLIMKNM